MTFCPPPTVRSMASHAHKEALKATRGFWQLLMHGQVAYEDLIRATVDINTCVNAADRVYR